MSFYCAFNATSFDAAGSLSFPLWTGGSTTTSWEVEVDFSVTSLASQITLVGNTGAVSGAFDIFTNGAIGLRAWVASAAGLVVVGNRYTAKVTREGTNTLRVYLKLASESTYGAAVATYSTANTIPYNALGRNQNTPVVRAVNFYGAKLTGGTYGETWSGLNAPSTGTTWTGANGNQITLQGTQGTADAWWVFYNSITNTRSLYPLNIPSGTPVSIDINNYFTGATSYAIQSGSLPAGLTLSGSIISGTVAANAASQFTIRASNSIDLLDVVSVVQVGTNWALSFDGVNDEVTFPDVLAGASTFEINFDLTIKAAPLSYNSLLSNNNSSGGTARNHIFTRSNRAIEVSCVIGGVRRVFETSAGVFTFNQRVLLDLLYDGANLTLRVDGVVRGSVAATGVLNTISGVGDRGFTRVGNNASLGYPNIDLYSLQFKAEGSTVRNYIPSGSGNALVDTINSANNGTLVNFPTDDSEWIGYGQASGDWYLNNATGGNSVINIPSVTIGNNTGDYIEMKAVASSGNESGIYRIVGVSSGYSALIGVEPTKLSISIGSSNTAITAGYTQPAIGEVFTVKLRKSGTNQYIASMNGVDFAPFTAYSTFTVDQLFRWATESTGAFKGGIYYVAISTNGGASATRYYDAKASGGSGNQLLDTAGGQHGTQAGTWPADNSEWRFIEPVISGGPFTVNLSTISPTSALYGPTVTKDKLVSLSTLSSTLITYSPTVTKDKSVSLTTIGSTVNVRTPSVVKGTSLTLIPSFIGSTVNVRTPTLLKDKLVTPVFLSSTVDVRNPTLLKAKRIDLYSLPSSLVMYDHEVLGGYTPIPDVVLYPAEGYGLHIRSAREMQEVIQLLAKRLAILEGRESP